MLLNLNLIVRAADLRKQIRINQKKQFRIKNL
uniref:Uncharacterized protein n=1 Tax=Siphoviridae sp. ctxMM9 TaxID=2827973 RepID=A0A8S5T810_9CAUD|nr:MAG TPA: hypothetical protein [Siphoviridae sp. ctxMM9]